MAGTDVNLFFGHCKAFAGVDNVFDKQYASVGYAMTERIEVIQGDITRQTVGAIVNAANTMKTTCWPCATRTVFCLRSDRKSPQ